MSEDAAKEVRYVGFSTRLYAAFIDTILVLLLIFPFVPKSFRKAELPPEIEQSIAELEQGLITHEQLASEINYYMLHGGGLFDMLTGTLVDFVIMGVLVITFWIYRSATPGKMLFATKIINVKTGDKPSIPQLIGRYFAYFLSGAFFFLGFIWILFDKKRQGWHDKLAGTAVIFTKPLDPEWKEKRFKRQTIMAAIIVILFLIFFM